MLYFKHFQNHYTLKIPWLCHKTMVMMVTCLFRNTNISYDGMVEIIMSLDLDLETGDTVLACWSGKIRYSKYNDGGFKFSNN